MTTSTDRLALRIKGLEREVKRLATQPQLGHSSFDQGAVTQFDPLTGDIVQQIGQQFDGTNTAAEFNGPTPPTPSIPILANVPGGIRVTWDSTFEDTVDGAMQVAPMNFSKVTVHVSTTNGFDALVTLPAAVIPHAGGGSATVAIPTEGTYYVKLVAWSASGKPSAASAQASIAATYLPSIEPTTSPAPTVVGGIGMFHVSWPVTANPTGYSVEVHISDDTVLGASFAPGPTTLAATSSGTMATISVMPDGVTALDPAKTYWIKLVATNDAGEALPSAAATATLHLITGPDIAVSAAWVGTMTADHLRSGDMVAEALLVGAGGVIARGTSGEEVAMRPTGFTVKGSTAKGSPPYVTLPTSGAPNIISGTLSATTLEVIGDATTGKAMSLFKNSELAAGALFKINSVVTAPLSQPIGALEYPQTQTIHDFFGGTVNTAGGHGGFFWNSKTWIVSSTAVTSLRAIDPTTGVQTDIVDLTTKISDLAYTIGATKIGTTIYVLYQPKTSTTTIRVARLNESFVQQGSAVTVYTLNVDAVNVWHGALGTDGTNLLLGYYRKSDSKFIIKSISDLTGFTGGTTFVTDLNWAVIADTPVGLSRGTFDFSGDRFVIPMRQYTYVYTTAATPVRKQTEEWYTPSWQSYFADACCCVWDGTYWRWVSGEGKTGRYSPLTWATVAGGGAANNPYLAVFLSTTKYDNVAGVETDQSPRYTFSLIKRMALRVTNSLAGAPRARIYIGQTNTRTAMQRQTGEIVAPNEALLLETVDVTSPATANPPATSTFSANPASIESTDGGSYWRGDNSAKFLQLVVASTTDATALAGNKPPLRVGDIAGKHMRIDGNQVQAMFDDDTADTLFLNTEPDASGAIFPVTIGNGSQPIRRIKFGQEAVSFDVNGEGNIAHGLGVTPDFSMVSSRVGGGLPAVSFAIVAEGGTNITVRATRVSDGSVVNATRSVAWMAVRF